MADKPNWRSKSMVAHLAHLGVSISGLLGILFDHTNAHIIVPAVIGGHTAIAGLHNSTTAATERAQAYSPNYPLPVSQEPPGPGVVIRPPD